MEKDELLKRVLRTVLSAEVAKGHLKWKVSDIARNAKVSRPLVYYYFGRSKREILTYCLELIADEYYGLNQERTDLVRAGDLLGSLQKTRAMFLDNPALAIFYLTYRAKDSAISRQLEAIEVRYQRRLQGLFPHLSREETVAVHAIFHGLVTAPFLSDDSLKAALGMIRATLNRKPR